MADPDNVVGQADRWWSGMHALRTIEVETDERSWSAARSTSRSRRFRDCRADRAALRAEYDGDQDSYRFELSGFVQAD